MKSLSNKGALNTLFYLQSKTYDSVTEKYLDFSFEKTNSAYMLFYEWRSGKGGNEQRNQSESPTTECECESFANA